MHATVEYMWGGFTRMCRVRIETSFRPASEEGRVAHAESEMLAGPDDRQEYRLYAAAAACLHPVARHQLRSPGCCTSSQTSD